MILIYKFWKITDYDKASYVILICKMSYTILQFKVRENMWSLLMYAFVCVMRW